jgi:peptidoglycan/xylan/chitin deacetylase (PgdA/CDA1 family)
VPDLRKRAIRAGLETLYFTGTHRLARSFFAGIGAILTFHRVLPPHDEPFQPHRGLEVTPAFLDAALAALRQADVDIVSMDEAWRRLNGDPGERRFVAVTFDDGYRDTLEYAWPILKRHGVPFTLFVASAFAEGTGVLWWEALGQAVAKNSALDVEMDGALRHFDCSTPQAKDETFAMLYGWLRGKQHETDLEAAIGAIAAENGIDTGAQCRELCMGWENLAGLAADPLVTIGAHTVSHPFLAKCDDGTVRAEMTGSRLAIEQKLGVRPQHFAYPVGAPDAVGPREFAIAAEVGYRTGVTTRPGVIFADHSRHPTALPRISVNGEFQQLRFLEVLLSGTATALLNGFRRIDAA